MHYRTTSLFDPSSSAKTPPPMTSTTKATTITNDDRNTSSDRNLLTTVRRNRGSTNTNSHPSELVIDSGGGTTTNNHGDTTMTTTTTTSGMQQQHPVVLAVPGRPRRKRVMNPRKRRSAAANYTNFSLILRRIQNFIQQQWMTMTTTKNSTTTTKRPMNVSLYIAILLWYSLGVFSIASSKILLTGSSSSSGTTTTTMIRVNPLTLTLQQLLIGVSLLRFFLSIGVMNTSGIKSWPPKGPTTVSTISDTTNKASTNHLILSSVCFACGFYMTNVAFAGSAASFVETVKAAEPITSATVASMYGIETITGPQILSLGMIIVGVLLSTLGGGGGSSHSSTSGTIQQHLLPTQTMNDTLRACMIVMTANLCFSYRGLYQKLFRNHPLSNNYDDLNLQYRMQYYGVFLLSVPTFLFDILPYLLREFLLSKETTSTERHLDEVMSSDVVARYISLSLFNGIAFTCYNLASTWILSRISVVHHAALNCIRRVFAVIVTSIYFGVPITWMGAIGIGFAVIGFMSYTHYKVTQQQQSVVPAVSPGQSRIKQHTLLPLVAHDSNK